MSKREGTSKSIWTNDKFLTFVIPLLAIAAGLVVGAVVILCMGKDPLTAYKALLQGCGLLPKGKYAAYKGMLTDFASFVNCWTPMILAALAVAVAMKTGLFNIGVAGQMLTAGFIATVLIGYSSLPAAIAIPLVILTAAGVGMGLGAFVGWLKYKFNINEVVSTIMINYIARYVVSFFILLKYVHPVSRQSYPAGENACLTKSDVLIGGLKMDLPFGILIAVAAVVITYILLQKTVLGYELKAVGTSPSASRYAGIKVGDKIVTAMAISGALAGLAGAAYYLGYFTSIQPKVLPGMGYDAIAVAVLANNHPVGVLFSSFLISIISKGSTYMSSAAGVESEVGSLIIAVILLFSALGYFFKALIKRKAAAKENAYIENIVKEEKTHE